MQQHAIDLALRDTPRHRWNWREVARILPKARRFIFPTEASARLAEIMDSATDLILLNHQFALAPYEVTYIEVDLNAIANTLRPKKALNVFQQIGFLITKDSVWTCSHGLHGKRNVILATMGVVRLGHDPYTCEINSIRDVFENADISEKDDWQFARLAHLIGADGVRALIDCGEYERIGTEIIFKWSSHSLLNTKCRPREWSHTMGDLLILFAALLTLNQPKTVVTSFAPQRGIVRGKPVVYAAHHTVEIGMTKEVVRAFPVHHGDRESPRRHEVRGHFVHYPASARHHCSRPEGHDWPREPELHGTAPSWKCTVCGGIRTWRQEFQRGDASKGFVTKDYEFEP